MYSCEEVTCPNNKTQPLYCSVCSQKKDTPHNHRGFHIYTLVDTLKEEFGGTLKEFGALLNFPSVLWIWRYKFLFQLFELFKSESEMVLVKDLEKFIELKAEVTTFYDKEIKPLAEAEDLIGLRRLN